MILDLKVKYRINILTELPLFSDSRTGLRRVSRRTRLRPKSLGLPEENPTDPGLSVLEDRKI